MRVEMNWNSEDLDISLTQTEAAYLKSFVEFFTREKLSDEIVVPGEYDVAQTLYKELSEYIDDEVHMKVAEEYIKTLLETE